MFILLTGDCYFPRPVGQAGGEVPAGVAAGAGRLRDPHPRLPGLGWARGAAAGGGRGPGAGADQVLRAVRPHPQQEAQLRVPGLQGGGQQGQEGGRAETFQVCAK